MNSIIKSIGLAIIVIAAIVLMLSFFLGWTNNNSVQFGALAAMIVGLIVYIIFGKKCLAEEYISEPLAKTKMELQLQLHFCFC